MELLKDLSIPAFSRIVWTSESARLKYEKLIQKSSSLIQELEVLSVAAGHRKCAWQNVDEDIFNFRAIELLSMGLAVLPVKKVGKTDGFAHYHLPPSKDGKNNVCFIVAQKYTDALDFRRGFEEGDHEKQGYYLGFPECCRKFFSEHWKAGYIDPIWQAAENSEIIEKESRRRKIKKHPLSNPMLRYVGIRVCFHIPCSFHCEETIRLSRERLLLTENSLDEFVRLLDMPMSWDVIAGTAVIRTPIFYVVTSSVTSIQRYIVEAEGDFRPDESTRGIGFPFNEVKT